MIDIHSHILPGMDDGSRDTDMSLRMLESISRQDIDTVFMTPHFYADINDPETFLLERRKSFENLVSAITTSGIPCPRLLVGSEVHYYRGIGKSEHIDKFCMGRSRFLLVEPMFRDWTPAFVDEVRELGYTTDLKVIIAHIERYLDQDRDLVDELINDRNIYIQANGEFFTDRRTRRRALKMFGEGKIDFLGSDCHNMTSRAPNLEEAMNIITDKFGPDALSGIKENNGKLLREAMEG